MSDVIIQQSNGQYCVYSTLVDDLVVFDCDEDELETYFITKAIEREKLNFDAAFRRVSDPKYRIKNISRETIDQLVCRARKEQER
jgi:hypothetical protein